MNALRKCLVTIAASGLACSAYAITYIVPTDRDLVRDARAIVIGSVIDSHPELNAAGGIVTVADFEVEQILKGSIPDNAIRIVEPGGFLSERAMMIPGSPRYEQGARYLVLLDQWNSGEWRTEGFQLGQFQFTKDLGGREYLSRGGGEAIYGLDASSGNPYVDRLRAAGEFFNFIRTVAVDANAPAREDYFADRSEVIPADALTRTQNKLAIAPNSYTRPSYLLSGNYRWQSGPNASWGYCCPGQYPSLFNGPSAATSAVGAWNGNSTSINYSMTGETPGATGGLTTPDGKNTVLFNDPNNLIGNSGAFAVGGISAVSGTYSLSDGFTYSNPSEVDVVVTQNTKIPGFVTQFLATSLLTHEVGHTLGFRHADGTASPSSPPPACDPTSSECANSSCGGSPPYAVMAHCIQSPGLNLQAWDQHAAQTVYGSGPVCTPPSITSGPTAMPSTITAGQMSTLSVTANGTTPTYAWFIGMTGDTSNPAPAGTAASINVSPSVTTTYWVQVTACGTNTNSSTVTVTVNPATCTPVSILLQPQSTTITAGQTATLTLGVSGSTPFTFQWFQGTPPSGTPIGGATSNAISVNPTVTTTYYAQATNCGGTVTSAAATVNVAATCTAVGQVTATAVPPSIPPGQSVLLQAAVGAGTQPFAYQWFRGTAPDMTNPISGANAATFTDTPSVTTSYWVQVTNCGAANTANSNTVTVTVGTACTAPSITVQPADQTIVIGTTATLTVTAAGTNVHYTWYQGTLGDTQRPVGSDSPSYKTPPLTMPTPYWVHVQDDCGAVNSTTATINVRTGRPHAVRH